MCGPATVPMTFASTPKCPSASTRLRRGLAPARRCRAASARRSSASAASRASGSSQTKSGSSVTAPRSRPCGVQLGRVRVRDAGRSPRSSSSSSRAEAARRADAVVGSSCSAPSELRRVVVRRRPARASRGEGASTCVARTISSSGAGSGGSMPSAPRRLRRPACRPLLAALAGASVADPAHHARRVDQAAAGRAHHAPRARRRSAGSRPVSSRNTTRMSTPTLWTSRWASW